MGSERPISVFGANDSAGCASVIFCALIPKAVLKSRSVNNTYQSTNRSTTILPIL